MIHFAAHQVSRQGGLLRPLRLRPAHLCGLPGRHHPNAWWRFFIFNASGGTLWAVIYGLGAYLLGNELERLSRPVDVGAGIAAAVVIVAFLIFLGRNEKRLEAEAERALPGPLDLSWEPQASR